MRSFGLAWFVWVLLSVGNASAQQTAELVEEPDPVARATAWTSFWREERSSGVSWLSVGTSAVVLGLSTLIVAGGSENDWSYGVGVAGIGISTATIGSSLAFAIMSPPEHALVAPTDTISLARWEGQLDGYVRMAERYRWVQAAVGWAGCAAGAAMLTWGLLDERVSRGSLLTGMGVMSMASNCTEALTRSLVPSALRADYENYLEGFAPPSRPASGVALGAAPMALQGGGGAALVGSF